MAESSGSATGNPRNKVALQPGYSLVGWIRLGNSGVDLAGTGGQIRSVSKEELAKHGTNEDAWIAIRGKVYNVTQYLKFHPGGVDELMRGAGTDATELFNQVHPWVNYEALLSKCLIGPLTGNGDDQEAARIFANTLTLSPPSSMPSTPSPLPSYVNKVDWYQQSNFVVIVIYLDHSVTRLHINNKTTGELWCLLNENWMGWKLHSAIQWPPEITLYSEKKIEVKLTKEGDSWSQLEQLTAVSKPPPSKSVKLTVKSVQRVNHDVFIIETSYVEKVYEFVPLGWHVLIKANVKNTPVERNYTPISIGRSSDVTFMIKAYSDGLLSPWISSRKANDVLTISQPIGSFAVSKLHSVSHLALIAAGVGFTPMNRIIQWALHSTKIIVKLLFFNKTEKDIFWKKELSLLMSTNSRFTVEHVLSNADTTWKGKKGYVTLQLLQDVLPDFSKAETKPYYTCVCGPIPFTQLTERYLQSMGYTSDNYFCFK